MDGVGQWRLVEPQEHDKEGPLEAAPDAAGQRGTLLLIVATVALVVAAAGVAIWATLPSGGTAIEQQAGPAHLAVGPMFGSAADESPREPARTAAAVAELAAVVVDVQGAVVQPGVHELPIGSRVADAIAAAGGYAPTIDIAAASQRLNLAEKLVDGSQIHVPSLGDEVGAPASAETPSAGSEGRASGLIDLNTATAEQLETLPGIGPVTAAKIIDARTQASFASVDELLARDVVGTATFEKIRDLVTVSP